MMTSILLASAMALTIGTSLVADHNTHLMVTRRHRATKFEYSYGELI